MKSNLAHPSPILWFLLFEQLLTRTFGRNFCFVHFSQLVSSRWKAASKDWQRCAATRPRLGVFWPGKPVRFSGWQLFGGWWLHGLPRTIWWISSTQRCRAVKRCCSTIIWVAAKKETLPWNWVSSDWLLGSCGSKPESCQFEHAENSIDPFGQICFETGLPAKVCFKMAVFSLKKSSKWQCFYWKKSGGPVIWPG